MLAIYYSFSLKKDKFHNGFVSIFISFLSRFFARFLKKRTKGDYTTDNNALNILTQLLSMVNSFTKNNNFFSSCRFVLNILCFCAKF